MTKSVLTGFILLMIQVLSGQKNDVLFSVEDSPVSVSEFKYIYEKNNRENASYTKESIEEYLELYINFKLKVQRAKELGLHNKESYKQELLGYRRQLADSYVIDREVIDQIVDDIFERKKTDVQVKHILVSVRKKTSEAATDNALRKLKVIQEALKNGMSFEAAAKQYSDDKGSGANNGNIGYISAALPDGYVELENAIYEMKVGEVSAPVRTDLGFHILKVESIRPSRGKMEVQHILIRNKKNGRISTDSKSRIDTIYQILSRDGSKFDMMAKTLSEDKQTAGKNGQLGFFGIGEYEQSFEDGAFALLNDGDLSKPVETSIGWHVIKRLSKKSHDTKEQLKAMVKGQLNEGERFEIQKAKVVEEIKVEGGFIEYPEAIILFRDSLNNSFFEYNWTVTDYPDKVICKLGDKSYVLNDFAEFCKSSGKTRLKASNRDIDALVTELYSNFVQAKSIAFIEEKLEDRYDEFRNLLREYEEGILLFEITKDEVWDKASKDTIGLKNYFQGHSEKYIWEPRADVSSYSVRSVDKKVIAMILNDARIMEPQELLEKYNVGREVIMHETAKVERSSELVRGLQFSDGMFSRAKFNNGLKITTFNKIEKTYPAAKKSLKESKGYVISDYQDQLEKEWIKSLRTKYDVNISKKVLKNLIAD